MPFSIAVQRACTVGLPCASLPRLHSPALSLVSCTSYSQVRTLRPPTALLVTATLPLNSALNCPPQPMGQGPPLATVESPAIQMVMFGCVPLEPPPLALPALPGAPPEFAPPVAERPPLPPAACVSVPEDWFELQPTKARELANPSSSARLSDNRGLIDQLRGQPTS